MTTRNWGLHLGAILIPLALAGCTDREGAPPAAEPAKTAAVANRIEFPVGSPQLRTVGTDTAMERGVISRRFTGRLIWDEERTVRVFSPVAGRIEALTAKVGATVSKGQSLATISSPDFGQMVAETRKAEADFRQAERVAARQRDLLEHGVAAARDAQSAEADLERARVELERTKARAALLGGVGGGQSYLLRTPLPGLVVERNVNPGQEVRPDQITANSPPLFVVSDPTRLWVALDVGEKDLGLIAVGQMVVVECPTYPGIAFPAEIVAIPDYIDTSTRTIRVRGRVNNPDRRLKAEMYVSAILSVPDATSIAIPAAATFLVGQTHYVFVERSPGVFDRVEVDLGPEFGRMVTVTRGIQVGDHVVSTGALFLQQALQAKG